LPSGRYKINRKLHLSDRLKSKVIAEPIGNLKKDQYIEKKEIDYIKDLFANNKFESVIEYNLTSPNKLIAKQSNKLDMIKVYFSNSERNKTIELIAPHDETDSRALTLADFISFISYACETKTNTLQYDDIEHLGNKRIKLINEQLMSKLNIGLAKVEKTIKDKLSSL
jgi:DNA-directed RNA polymerase subunit beta